MKRYLKLSLGWILLVVGFIGLFLPFIQGLLLMGIGAALLSRESDRLKIFFHRIKSKTLSWLKSSQA